MKNPRGNREQHFTIFSNFLLTLWIPPMRGSLPKTHPFLPDLTGYLPALEAVADRLREARPGWMDAVKSAMEMACKHVLLDVRVEKRRKLSQTLQV
jgi:hypothetical protein